MQADLRETWEQYYQENSGDTVLKDRNFFELELNAILGAVEANLRTNKREKVFLVELGSGLGAFAAHLEARMASLPEVKFQYTGFDFSESAVEKSNARGLQHSTFIKNDFLSALKTLTQKPDIIVTQRSVMALMEAHEQKELLTLIRDSLNEGGQAILSEGSRQGLDQLKALRNTLGLSDAFDKVWHSLYLDEEMIKEVFGNSLKIIDYSSLYWLITRVVYPFFETPKHNSKIHDFAAKLAPSGNFGLVKLYSYGK